MTQALRRSDIIGPGSAPASGAVEGASPATSATETKVNRLMGAGSSRPIGEGADWMHPRRARSPFAIAWFRLREVSLLLFALLTISAHAHIGSPNVFFEGDAGPFAVRVVIRPPEVVPGLADIHVRVLAGDVRRVTVLPVHWQAGKKGAPPPDEAIPVPGETGLFAAQLWLMDFGAYSVFVNVEGPRGSGTAIVPLNSVASTRLAMPPWMAASFLVLGATLFCALIAIVGAAVRESVLPPGAAPVTRSRVRARWAMAGATMLFGAILLIGEQWWDKVDSNFKNNRLYQPTQVMATAKMKDGKPTIEISRDKNQRVSWDDHTPLAPDHGKLMHLFLIREPELDALAHLHPVRANASTFESVLPAVPPGKYRVYADVTHESGFAQTWISTVEVPPPVAADSPTHRSIDSDDSWYVSESIHAAASSGVRSLGDGYTMRRIEPSELLANRETTLQFAVRDAKSQPAPLEFYLGMVGHAIVRNQDGSVFTHLHPLGTISMASQRLFAQRERQEKSMMPSEDLSCGKPNAISFPYAFPRSGRYRIWVQVKLHGTIRTGAFDVDVAAN